MSSYSSSNLQLIVLRIYYSFSKFGASLKCRPLHGRASANALPVDAGFALLAVKRIPYSRKFRGVQFSWEGSMQIFRDLIFADGRSG